ncbi:MAG: cell division protein ZapB [Clostridiales bacterium]|nr:cell division protein ZapB [Clostridiales bacterium]
MPLVPAICTQCGARLEVDPNCEAAICKYCNTPFITEKAINNYNTTYVTNIGHLHADVVHINDDSSRDSRVKSGETFLKFNDYTSAEEVFSKLTKECPYDYRGWWGLVRVYSRKFTDFSIGRPELSKMKSMYDKACTVATPQEKSAMDAEYKPYSAQLERRLSERLNDTRQRMQQESYEFEAQKRNLESRINALSEQQKSLKQPSKILTIVLGILILIVAIDLFSGYAGAPAQAILFQFIPIVIVLALFALGIKYTVGKVLDTSYYKKVDQLGAEISSLRNALYNLSNANAARVRDYNETLTKMDGRR